MLRTCSAVVKNRDLNLSRGKRATIALLSCGLVLLLSGCIKRYSVVDPPAPPPASQALTPPAK